MLHLKNGFTLVEVLIVLSILGMTLLLSVPLNSLFLEKQREQQFIQVFSSDMLLMQSYSRTRLSTVRFHYDKEKRKYKINKLGDDPLIERDLPKGWDIDMRTVGDIQFAYSGSIRKGGTIVLKTKHHSYKFIFSVGKGRFRVEKQ